MSRQSEIYHLGGMEEFEDDWQPFDEDDPIPSDVEDEPPSDGELGEGEQTNFDLLPEVEESPPPVEKKPRAARKQSSNEKPKHADERSRNTDEEAIDSILNKHLGESEYASPYASKKKPAAGKKVASGGKALKRQKAVSQEDIEQHMSLVLKIDKYRTSQRFADCLARSRLPLGDAPNMSIEELEELIIRINVVVGNRHAGSGGMLGAGIVMGANVIEKLPITKRFANLDGWAASLQADDEFGDICEQISIDYSILDNMSPEKRLLFCLGKNAANAVGRNKMKERIAEHLQATRAAPQPPQPQPQQHAAAAEYQYKPPADSVKAARPVMEADDIPEY